MKTIIKRIPTLLILFSILMISGCFSTRGSASKKHPPPPSLIDGGYGQMDARDSNQADHMVYPNREKPSNMSLNDMLRRLPGVRILGGRGPNASIVVRGTSTFITSTDPLFVLNGVVIGTDFRTVHASVNPREVISLNVLAGPDATIYGTRGSNGVILIRTR